MYTVYPQLLKLATHQELCRFISHGLLGWAFKPQVLWPGLSDLVNALGLWLAASWPWITQEQATHLTHRKMWDSVIYSKWSFAYVLRSCLSKNWWHSKSQSAMNINEPSWERLGLMACWSFHQVTDLAGAKPLEPAHGLNGRRGTCVDVFSTRAGPIFSEIAQEIDLIFKASRMWRFP